MSIFLEKRHITQEVPYEYYMSIIPSKIEIDFIDEQISPSTGSIFLSEMAEKRKVRGHS